MLSDEKHRLLSQVVRPQESRAISPAHVLEEKPARWKEDERKSDRKEGSKRYEEPEVKERVSASEKQKELLVDADISKTKDIDNPVQHKQEEKEISDKLHDDKTKKKMLKKTVKKKKDEDILVEKIVTETPKEEVKVFSPKKAIKKKNLEKKRKKGDSDVSDEELTVQLNKKKKGPRTPPVIVAPVPIAVPLKEELPEVLPEKITVEPTQTTFSDWSDEDVPDKGEAFIPDRITEEPIKKPVKLKVEKEEPRLTAVDEPPSRKLPEQKRSSSISSNQSRTSGRIRSPSIDSVHRSGDDPVARRKILPGGSKDRERTKSNEPSGERKSRIDQLKRGEPSRSTSSGKLLISFINYFV